MGKIFLTSDLHFNHKNILAYESESRPFENIPEMNEALIANWNNVVSNEDDVWVLGDFFMGQLMDIGSILSRLNGKIHLVRGNHDTKNRLTFYEYEFGIDIHDIAYINYKGRFFILCHFPLASEEFIKMVRQDNSEAIICYGHIHHNAPKGYVDGTFHVGADTNDLTPVDIEDIWQQSWPKEDEITPEVKEYKEFHANDCGDCVDYLITCNGNNCKKSAAEGSVTEKTKTCHGCIWECICTLAGVNTRCSTYQREPKDGGFYG